MSRERVRFPRGIDRHGGGYRVRVMVNGYRHIETGFRTLEEAQARANELHAIVDGTRAAERRARADARLAARGLA